MLFGKRSNLHAAILAVAVVVVLCAALVACQQHEDGVGCATTDATSSGGGNAAVSDVHDVASPLFKWEEFDCYWMTDSSGHPIRLNDDSLPGDGVGRSWVLRGASRIGQDDPWDVEAVDCSTGDTSYWKASAEIAERLSETSPNDLLGGDLVRLDGDRWRFFDNYPRARSDVEREAEDYVMDHEQGILFEVDAFRNADERMRRAVVRSADGNLRDALVVMYGVDEIRGCEGE